MKEIKSPKRKLLKEEKGITLITLAITILIIIILSGVTINMVLGDEGLLKQAVISKDMVANSIAAEEEKMDEVEKQYANEMAEERELPLPEVPFEPHETPEPETGGEEMEDMTNGVIEIKWLSGTSYNVSDTPNSPLTKTISNGTMELVKFNSSNNTWETGTEYSYVPGTGSSDNTQSKWANARVTINDVDSYFVWIPRYAYRIIYFDTADSKKAYQEGTLTEADAVANGQIIGYSDSRGIVDAQGRKIDSITSESNTTKIMVSEDYFMVHPAFTNEVNYGGWSSQIAGIWIGKYETARSDTQGATQGSATTLKVQPGVTSFRNVSIGNMYKYSQNYARELESHMLKNSEWGAVAYLTESKYGRNGTEVTQNRVSGYITGGGTGTAYAETNTNQSSTGNVYGVYDLNGGTHEYVASYLKNGDFSHVESTFTDNTSDAYSTAYDTDNASTGYKYGDATYETSGWHSDGARFVNSNTPFFNRGGYRGYAAADSGIFYFSYSLGSSGSGLSFRVALVL